MNNHTTDTSCICTDTIPPETWYIQKPHIPKDMPVKIKRGGDDEQHD